MNKQKPLLLINKTPIRMTTNSQQLIYKILLEKEEGLEYRIALTRHRPSKILIRKELAKLQKTILEFSNTYKNVGQTNQPPKASTPIGNRVFGNQRS